MSGGANRQTGVRTNFRYLREERNDEKPRVLGKGGLSRRLAGRRRFACCFTVDLTRASERVPAELEDCFHPRRGGARRLRFRPSNQNPKKGICLSAGGHAPAVRYPVGHLWVEAKDANEADLFVLVEKLDKDGNLLVPDAMSARQYFPIPPAGAHGRLRVSLRRLDPTLSTDFMPVQSFDRPQMLHAGEIVPVDIAIMPASEVFHAGEQLRLTIAGHEFAAPGPKAAPSGLLAFMHPIPPVPTHNSGVHVIHGGGDHQSFLQIPVIPVGQ